MIVRTIVTKLIIIINVQDWITCLQSHRLQVYSDSAFIWPTTSVLNCCLLRCSGSEAQFRGSRDLYVHDTDSAFKAFHLVWETNG